MAANLTKSPASIRSSAKPPSPTTRGIQTENQLPQAFAVDNDTQLQLHVPPANLEAKITAAADWQYQQGLKKRDFQEQNPPRTVAEYYAQYDPWIGFGTGIIFMFLLTIITTPLIIKWINRQIKHHNERKLNPEVYNIARNWDGRPETLLSAGNLSPELLATLQQYQQILCVKDQEAFALAKKSALQASVRQITEAIQEKYKSAEHQENNSSAIDQQTPTKTIRAMKSVLVSSTSSIAETEAILHSIPQQSLCATFDGTQMILCPRTIDIRLLEEQTRQYHGQCPISNQSHLCRRSTLENGSIITCGNDACKPKRPLVRSQSLNYHLKSRSVVAQKAQTDRPRIHVVATTPDDESVQSLVTLREEAETECGSSNPNLLAIPTRQSLRFASCSSDPCSYLETNL